MILSECRFRSMSMEHRDRAKIYEMSMCSMNLTYSLTSCEILLKFSKPIINNIRKLRMLAFSFFIIIVNLIDNYTYDESDDDRSKCDFADSPMKLSSNNTYTHST